ncbi:hypothetical protein B0J18DRAFT_56795 [Chaetomium sp. MPI-SDFR-AT-0129]|nr:hypothetical protein B0J18DRAFT_56795 [Chaetomium sp. MPI-SDFR-AT-0129]
MYSHQPGLPGPGAPDRWSSGIWFVSVFDFLLMLEPAWACCWVHWAWELGARDDTGPNGGAGRLLTPTSLSAPYCSASTNSLVTKYSGRPLRDFDFCWSPEPQTLPFLFLSAGFLSCDRVSSPSCPISSWQIFRFHCTHRVFPISHKSTHHNHSCSTFATCMYSRSTQSLVTNLYTIYPSTAPSRCHSSTEIPS